MSAELNATDPDDLALEAAVRNQLRLAGQKRNTSGKPTASRTDTPAVLNAARQRTEAELHQARVLLLVDALAGENGSLDGLTKLAKLDFLLRYPVFLEQLIQAGAIKASLDDSTCPTADERIAVESRMMRYKYGPWDDRYYSIIGALVGRGLLEYVPSKGKVALKPTVGGRAIANALRSDHAWRRVAARSALLKRALGRSSGNMIKDLVYAHLPEVVNRPHRTEI